MLYILNFFKVRNFNFLENFAKFPDFFLTFLINFLDFQFCENVNVLRMSLDILYEKNVTFDTPDTSAPQPNIYRANNCLSEFAKVSSVVFHERSPGDLVYRYTYIPHRSDVGKEHRH